MKLETHLNIKHVSPYLPYESTFYVDMEDFTNGNSKPELRKFNLDSLNLKICIFYGKLALRPLSDLKKEIEVNGENFVPIEWFEIGDDSNDSEEYDHGNIKLIKTLERISKFNISNDILYLPHGVVQKLYQWNFDLHSLIEKNLAIDINTLKK